MSKVTLLLVSAVKKPREVIQQGKGKLWSLVGVIVPRTGIQEESVTGCATNKGRNRCTL